MLTVLKSQVFYGFLELLTMKYITFNLIHFLQHSLFQDILHQKGTGGSSQIRKINQVGVV
jgi:hypothetical protein